MIVATSRMLWIAIVAVLPFHAALGQFAMDSHAPAHGAVQVETSAVIELTFSEPVDTDAEFDAAGGSFLVTELYPYPGEPTTISFADDRTVRLSYTLAEDTQYWMLVWAALSTEGELLDAPRVFTFTTGASLPTASVSGTAASDEVSLSGTVVGLFPPDGLIGDGEGDAVGGLAVVDPATGAFEADYVAEGEYLVVGIRDSDFDGDPSGEDDAFGAYDPGGDGVMDVITVGAGEHLTGIDLTLRGPVWATARELLPAISAFAESNLPGAELAFAAGINVDPQGEATIWTYMFSTADASIEITTLAGTFFASPGPPPEPDAQRLPADWIDSDVALATSEEIGGAEFRSENPGAEVIAVLVMSDDPAGGFLKRGSTPHLRADASAPFATLRETLRAERLDVTGLAQASSDPDPLWMIQYFSDFGFLIVFIDAETGDVLTAIGLVSSADDNLEAAQAAALAWSADARLVFISDEGFEGVRPDGRATGWLFVYYDATSDEARIFLTSGGFVSGEGEFPADDLPSTVPLPDSWVSSAAAAASADAASDGFRSQHETVSVSAMLARGLRQHGITRPIWRFEYLSWDDGTQLTVDVDARTGLVVTSSETPAPPPHAVRLHPGYPNPFTSSTALRFDLASTAPVRVAVYDALGREVALLVDGVLGAGSHTLEWHPEMLPSGLYVARLTTGGVQRSAVLTLVR